MIPELGNIALILALCMAVIQSVLPITGTFTNNQALIRLARPAASLQLTFMVISFACLLYAFITHDFSVRYVAENSNTRLPFIYLVSGVWGAHEGSLLLWALVLSIWTMMVNLFSRGIPEDMVARVLAVMGLISIGFILFILLTSNPFARQFPVPIDGFDLNPLLQDPGLAIHPPMLYMGYVGFSVAFAFAIAAMLQGKLDAAWARWARPWTMASWIFLTLGIALGSWWAYYELGWGGWWFWDPVENASFMPWLVGTGLLHSLAVTDKRNTFKAWTVLLSVLAFSLSLLGTFLVRSGVLTSVHAFASDPARGVFILIFLVIVVGGSLSLFAWRASIFKNNVRFNLLSRETFMLLNAVLFVVMAGFILLGTLYPLLLDALNMGKVSVGPPYFNTIFIPLGIPIVLILGIGITARWKQDNGSRLIKALRMPMILSVVLGTVTAVVLVRGVFTAELASFKFIGAELALILAWWIVINSGKLITDRLKNRDNKMSGLQLIPRAVYGMTVAHIGVAVFVVGIILTSLFSIEKDVRLSNNSSVELAGYEFVFEGVRNVLGPNYQAAEGRVLVRKDDKDLVLLHPQKRYYPVKQNTMTEAAIDASLWRDLFVALGEPLGGSPDKSKLEPLDKSNTGAWSVRVYYKPFIRWIWLGALIMSIGGFISATDKRYRVRKLAKQLNMQDNEVATGA